MHDGRYLAEAVSLGGTRVGPTGEGRTPDRAAFMALVLLQQYPEAYAASRRPPAAANLRPMHNVTVIGGSDAPEGPSFAFGPSVCA